MSVIVKICGLSTPEALDVALEAGADMVGFVFFAPSPRHLTFERAHALASRVLERAQKVALTVDADDALLDAVVEALQPDMLQLHGTESPARVEAVQAHVRPAGDEGFADRQRKAISTASSVMPASPIACCSTRVRRARRRGRAGSAGRSTGISWKISIPACRSCCRAASMPTNVGEALRITRAPGVDVSSGVERAPGEKDPDKIRAFVRAARVAAASVASPA